VIQAKALDAPTLSAAIRQLLALRSALGDAPTTSGTFRVRRQVPQRPGAKEDELAFAPRLVGELRRAVPRQIAGVGLARAVEISVPSQN
jgi:hypothetical protein